MRVLKSDPVGEEHTKYQEYHGKRRTCRKRSGRCPTRQVASQDEVFALLVPEVVVKVAHLTAEAFFSRRSSMARVAERAKTSQNRPAF